MIQLTEQVPALMLPLLTVGYYPAFMADPGSGSSLADSFPARVGEMVDHLLGAMLDDRLSQLAKWQAPKLKWQAPKLRF